MKVTVHVEGYYPSTFEIDHRQAETLCQNSLERVLNTVHEVALHSTHADANVVMDDITELKRLAVYAWVSVQNAVFAAVNNVRD